MTLSCAPQGRVSLLPPRRGQTKHTGETLVLMSNSFGHVLRSSVMSSKKAPTQISNQIFPSRTRSDVTMTSRSTRGAAVLLSLHARVCCAVTALSSSATDITIKITVSEQPGAKIQDLGPRTPDQNQVGRQGENGVQLCHCMREHRFHFSSQSPSPCRTKQGQPDPGPG